jgi:hypothetical protein
MTFAVQILVLSEKPANKKYFSVKSLWRSWYYKRCRKWCPLQHTSTFHNNQQILTSLKFTSGNFQNNILNFHFKPLRNMWIISVNFLLYVSSEIKNKHQSCTLKVKQRSVTLFCIPQNVILRGYVASFCEMCFTFWEYNF